VNKAGQNNDLERGKTPSVTAQICWSPHLR